MTGLDCIKLGRLGLGGGIHSTNLILVDVLRPYLLRSGESCNIVLLWTSRNVCWTMKLHLPFHHKAEFFIFWTNCSFNLRTTHAGRRSPTDERLGSAHRRNSPHPSSLADWGISSGQTLPHPLNQWQRTLRHNNMLNLLIYKRSASKKHNWMFCRERFVLIILVGTRPSTEWKAIVAELPGDLNRCFLRVLPPLLGTSPYNSTHIRLNGSTAIPEQY